MATDPNDLTQLPFGNDAIAGKRTVAFLDILGFKNRIQSEPLLSIAQVYEQAVNDIQFFNRRPANSARISLFPEHPFDVPFCKTFIFSDSLIMISNGPGASETLKTLLSARSALQVLILNGMPVRGAVTIGEMYINPVRNIFLGPALTRAFELEHSQEWVGALIEDEVMAEISNYMNANDEIGELLNKVFRKYPVPLKGNSVYEYHTLNWRACSVINNGVKPLFKFTGDEAIDVKFKNTLEYCKGALAVGPKDKTPQELATVWALGPPFKDPDWKSQ